MKHLIKCGGQRRSMACCENAGSNLWDLKARTQDIVDNEVVQTKNQRKFECLTKKPTEEFEQGIMQSSDGGTAMAAGRLAPEDCQMTLASVAESATTQSTTSSRIRVVETEDQFNTECHKVVAGTFDRHGTIVDMDTCRAIDKMTDPEDCDGWTQQVVDRNKKCKGAKGGHLGFLFESQKVSMRRIKEFANIEKLEVTEIMLQETIARTHRDHLRREARSTPEDPTADRGSDDAIITPSRIILSVVATKGIEKERHCTAGVVWRSMTAWNTNMRQTSVGKRSRAS